MDLRQYYQKIREAEAAIDEPYPVVVSHETGDGGKAGVPTEVTRKIASRMVVDGTARVASAEEAAAFRRQQAEASQRAQQAAEAAKVQVAVISPEDFRRLRSGSKPAKE